MSNLLKFIRLPWEEKKLFAEALFFLYMSWIMTLVLPFKECLKRVERKGSNKAANPIISNQISLALHRANYLRVWKNVCLVSTFAGRWMLNARNIESVLYIGALKEQGKFKAHAWLVSGKIEIVRKEERYLTLFEF
jgi:hypothetical protein